MKASFTLNKITAGLALSACLTAAVLSGSSRPVEAPETSVILSGSNIPAIERAVTQIGGEVTHRLNIIGAIGASLTQAELEQLRDNPVIQSTFAGGMVDTASGNAGGAPGPYAHFPSLVGADRLHDEGITGASIGVAIVDSGMQSIAELQKDTYGVWRTKKYNAIKDVEDGGLDIYGHGTHVASIILNTDYADDGTMRRNSIAPDAGAVPVKSFNKRGQGTYANVIRGLDWILVNKDAHNINVWVDQE